MAELRHILWCLVGLVFLPATQAQSCGSNSYTVATTDASGLAAATWVPDCTPTFEFCVQTGASTDGVADLYLSSTATRSLPFVWISLGWNDDRTAAGSSGTSIRSYIQICNSNGDCEGDDANDGQADSGNTGNGDVNQNGKTCFALYATITGNDQSLNVRNYGDSNAFMTINNGGDFSFFNLNDVKYVLLGAHQGDGATPSWLNDVTALAAEWDICTDNWESLATGAAVTVTTCGTPSTNCDLRVNDGGVNWDDTQNQCFIFPTGQNNAAIEIDLGSEMHVAGVTIYNVMTSGTADATLLEDFAVYVGSCTTAADNIPCGGPITSTEAASGNPPQPIYRDCPQNTYGRYVYVIDTSGATSGLAAVCEVVVHGKTIAEADKTTIQFDPTSYQTQELPGPDNMVTGTVTVTVKRTGSAHQHTCSSIVVANKGSGTATEGAAEDFDTNPAGSLPVTLDFTTGDNEEEVEVTIIQDCDNEGDENIVLELENPLNAVIGTNSEAEITIEDDDPEHGFSASTASVYEYETSITLTILRSEITDITSTVSVSTAQPGDANCANVPDVTGGPAGSNFEATVDADPATVDDVVYFMDQDVTFPASGSGATSQTIDVDIINDDGNEDWQNEEFCVILSKGAPNRGELITPWVIRVTILNDDTVYYFDSTNEVVEGDNFVATIRRRGKTDTQGCIIVYTQTVPNGASTGDFTTLSRTPVIFAGNELTGTATIPTIDDTDIEGTEQFDVILGLPTASECTSQDISPVVDNTDNADGFGEETVSILDNDTTYSVSALVNEIEENAGTVTVQFERSQNLDQEGTIFVTVYGSDDTNPNVGTSNANHGPLIQDFVRPNSLPLEVTFEVNSATAQLPPITIINDNLVELNEVFYVEIDSADSTINQGRKTTAVSIANDDGLFAIQQAERTVLESVNEFQVVILRGPAIVDGVTLAAYLEKDVTISVTTNSDQVTSAEAGEDFEPVSKTVTFYGATRDAVKTCVIELIDDQLIEGPEQFIVSISNDNVQIDPTRNQSIITIEDDDGALSCSIDGDVEATVEEDDESSVTVTCTRTGADNDDGDDQSLNRVATYILRTFSETASSGQDFLATTRTLTFPVNVATVTEELNPIKDDDIPEDDEIFRIEITGTGQDTGKSVLRVTIDDNDEEGFGFEKTEYTIGESCGELPVTIVRTGATGGFGTVLRVVASNGVGSNGATYPNDYDTQEVTVQFLGSQRQQVVTFHINSDNINEGVETFTLSLIKVSGSGDINTEADAATVTIQDQEVIYSVQDAVLTRDESSGTLPIYFVRSGDFCRDGAIYVGTREDTARRSEDYVSFNNRLVTFSGTSNTASVPLTILNDNDEEQTETFIVEILNNNNIIIGSGTTTVSIQDDDGRVYFRQTEYTVAESAGSVTLTINRVGNSISSTTVRVETRGGSASPDVDYVSVTSREVVFRQSESSKTFTLTILDDNVREDEETFRVRIVGTTDGTLSQFDDTEAIVTITDDDDRREGLTTGAIIGIAAGVGGGVLLLLIVGGIFCLFALRPRRQAPVLVAKGRGPPPLAYNGPAGYGPGYGSGPGFELFRQDYGQSRPRGGAYYR